jgi:fluoroquinolone resistance protein
MAMKLLAPHQDHYDQLFENIQLDQGELLSSEFTDCKFIQCSFEAASLSNCKFLNCSFENCNLSLAQISGSSFASTSFVKSKLIGIDWTQADWSGLSSRTPSSFTDCVISHSTFIGLELKGIEIIDCIAHEVDFREAHLPQAKFDGTDLDNSLFSNTDLTDADLSRASNYQIDPGSNILKKTKFSLPEAMALLHSMDIVLVENADLV